MEVRKTVALVQPIHVHVYQQFCDDQPTVVLTYRRPHLFEQVQKVPLEIVCVNATRVVRDAPQNHRRPPPGVPAHTQKKGCQVVCVGVHSTYGTIRGVPV